MKKLTNEELQKTIGGKNGINININVTWPQVRDSLKGFADGLFGHNNHY